MFLRHLKLDFNAREHLLCHELVIGIKDDMLLQPAKHDPAARPLFVFNGRNSDLSWPAAMVSFHDRDIIELPDRE